MVDGLGDSWSAVPVSLDVGQLLAGQAGVMSYAAALCIVAITALAGFTAMRLWERRRAAHADLVKRASQTDEEWDVPHIRNEIEEEWRSLRAKARTPALDTLAETPTAWACPARPDLLITYQNSVAGLDSPVSRSPVMAVQEGVAEPIIHDRQDTQDTRRARTPRKPSPKPRIPAEDASLSDIAQWAEDRLDRREDGRIQAQPLHAVYAAWCVARGKAPVTQYAFGLTMKELGWAKDKISGRIYYRDIAIRAPALRIVTSELSPAS